MCNECIDRDTPEQKVAKRGYHEWLSKHFQLGVEWRARYNNATHEAERLRRTHPEVFASYIPEGRTLGASDEVQG